MGLKTKIFTFLAIIVVAGFCGVALAACENATGYTALTTPAELAVYESKLSWSAVPHAGGYLVWIDDETPEPIFDNFYSLADLDLTQSHQFRVMARGAGDYADSDWSDTYFYIPE